MSKIRVFGKGHSDGKYGFMKFMLLLLACFHWTESVDIAVKAQR